MSEYPKAFNRSEKKILLTIKLIILWEYFINIFKIKNLLKDLLNYDKFEVKIKKLWIMVFYKSIK